jgi:hypothetical protein
MFVTSVMIPRKILFHFISFHFISFHFISFHFNVKILKSQFIKKLREEKEEKRTHTLPVIAHRREKTDIHS